MSGIRVTNFVVLVVESGSEVVHYVPKDDRVYIVPQHVEQEPVTQLGTSNN